MGAWNAYSEAYLPGLSSPFLENFVKMSFAIGSGVSSGLNSTPTNYSGSGKRSNATYNSSYSTFVYPYIDIESGQAVSSSGPSPGQETSLTNALTVNEMGY